MKRLLRETFLLAGAPIAVALAVLLVGTAVAQTPAEIAPPELWPVSECHTATVVGVAGSEVGGSALLCLAADAVRPAVYLSHLTPGRTYGVWLLASERSMDCGSSNCAGLAAVDAEYPGALARLGDVSASTDGTAQFRAHADGWAPGGRASVKLLVTNEGVGTEGASVFRPFRPTTPGVTALSTFGPAAHGAASVVAASTFRLP